MQTPAYLLPRFLRLRKPAVVRPALAAFHEATNSGHHFRGHLIGVSFRGAFVHAVSGVAVEQAEADLVQGGLNGRDLGKDVDAVPVVLDHLLDAADLPFDPS
jgi:hypothetical protein